VAPYHVKVIGCFHIIANLSLSLLMQLKSLPNTCNKKL